MRKDIVVYSIIAHVCAMAIWVLIGVTAIFSSRMPVGLAIVLRTLSATAAILRIWKIGGGAVELLKELWRTPERKHVTVDLKKGTITETK